MTLTLIESPRLGESTLHAAYAQACIADSLLRGESPFAAHVLYAQCRDASREQTRVAHIGWGQWADIFALYDDLGVTDEMLTSERYANSEGIRLERRTIGFGWAVTNSNVFLYGTSDFEVPSTDQEMLRAGARAVRTHLDDLLGTGLSFVDVQAIDGDGGGSRARMLVALPMLQDGVASHLRRNAEDVFQGAVDPSRVWTLAPHMR